MGRARVDRVVGDVTFVLQNTHDLRLDLRVRHEHVDLLRARGIADTRQKIGNRISHSAHKNQAAGCAAGLRARSLNGIPISLNSDLASSFVRAVVTIVTSNPILRLILSSSTSGKIVWSATPRV